MVAVKPDIADLIEWWEMNEASGNALGSHASKDMTDNNSVGAATGKVAGGRDFEDTSNHFFSRTSEAALQMGDIDATWVFWYKPESSGAGALINKDNITSAREYSIIHSASNKPQIFVFNGATGVIGNKAHSQTLSNGTWYLIAAYHSATDNEVGISVGGGAYETVATSGAAGTTTRPLWFGDREATSINLDGILDEKSYWKTKLSLDNLEWFLNSGNGRSYNALITPTPTIGGLSIFW